MCLPHGCFSYNHYLGNVMFIFFVWKSSRKNMSISSTEKYSILSLFQVTYVNKYYPSFRYISLNNGFVPPYPFGCNQNKPLSTNLCEQILSFNYIYIIEQWILYHPAVFLVVTRTNKYKCRRLWLIHKKENLAFLPGHRCVLSILIMSRA